MADADDRWLVLYDADCGFCTWLLAGLLRWDDDRRLRPMALQRPEAEALLADLTPEARMESWHLISPAGERWSGGAAIPEVLRLLRGGRAPATALAPVPWLTDRGYRWVAEHRVQISRLVRADSKRRAREWVRRREQAS